MKAYWFKFEQERGDQGEYRYWVGLAVAPDMKGIFWAVDEHGNPNEAVYQKATFGSMCRHMVGWENDWECVESDSSEFEPDHKGEWKPIDFERYDVYDIPT